MSILLKTEKKSYHNFELYEKCWVIKSGESKSVKCVGKYTDKLEIILNYKFFIAFCSQNLDMMWDHLFMFMLR